MRNIFTDSNVSAGIKVLFAILCGFDRGRGCRARRETIATLAGFTKGTVDSYLSELAKYGYVRIYRKKDRPAHIYVNPAARAAAGFPALADSNADLNHFSNPHIIEDEGCLKDEETTTHQVSPGSVPPEPEAEAAVVVQAETDLPVLRQTGQTEEPTPEPPEADRPAPACSKPGVPVVAPMPEAPPAAVPPAVALALPDAALTALAVLEDAGVARPAAVRLARTYPVRQIGAAVAYVRGYRSDVLNPGGLIRYLLESRATLPRWSYGREAAREAAGRTQEAQEARSEAGPTPGPQELDGDYWARYRAETWGWIGPLDTRPWAEIREELTEEARAYCEKS